MWVVSQKKVNFNILLCHNFVFIKDIITISNKADNIQDKINKEFRFIKIAVVKRKI